MKKEKIIKVICVLIIIAVGTATLVYGLYSIVAFASGNKIQTSEYSLNKHYVAQSSLGEISILQTEYERSKNCFTINGESIDRYLLDGHAEAEHEIRLESRVYCRFQYGGKRYLLLFKHIEENFIYKAGETFGALYYESGTQAMPEFIEKLDFKLA